MVSENVNNMEQGTSDDHRNLLASNSHDLRKPLMMSENAAKQRSQQHKRHSLRSRRDAILPKSGYAIFSTLVVALGPLSLGFAIGFTSPIQDSIVKDLGLTVAQFSTIGSILNVGCMIGAITSGRIADYIGRKRALLVAVFPLLAGWLLITLAHTAIPLIAARVLIGFGGGIISFTVPMYIGEIAPKHLRGSLGTMNQMKVELPRQLGQDNELPTDPVVGQLFITIGITLSYLCGILVNWRMLAALGALPEMVLIVGLFFIPESPRWLAKAGQKEELSSCLQKLRGKDHNITNEITDIQAAVEASNSLPSVHLSDLSQRKLFRPLIAGVGLMILQQFSGINESCFTRAKSLIQLVFQTPMLLHSVWEVCRYIVCCFSLCSNLGHVIFFLVVMTLAAAGLMDKAGRRILLMVSAGGMALSSFLVGFSFYLRALQPERMSDALNTFICMLALVSLLVYIAAFSLGIGAIPWIIMSEVFPAHVKGVAGSAATLINWFCSYAVTMIFNYMLLWSAAGSFWIFAAECVATIAFVAFYVPETRGRSLEQIEASFI